MNQLNQLASFLSVPQGYYALFAVLVVILAIVVALLKGLALWRSARKNQKVWFWVLLFVNTIGILEIVYLLTNRDIGAKVINKKVGDIEEGSLENVASDNSEDILADSMANEMPVESNDKQENI